MKLPTGIVQVGNGITGARQLRSPSVAEPAEVKTTDTSVAEQELETGTPGACRYVCEPSSLLCHE